MLYISYAYLYRQVAVNYSTIWIKFAMQEFIKKLESLYLDTRESSKRSSSEAKSFFRREGVLFRKLEQKKAYKPKYRYRFCTR